jgi:transcriptional regulator
MYIPASFRETDIDRLHELIRAHPLGLLVTNGVGSPEASPIPFLLDPGVGKYGALHAHMARANPHWKALAELSECLVIFQGANGYVTPSWYPGKEATHKVVPTWNYAMVHVRGSPSVITDTTWLRRQLAALTGVHEMSRPQPWSLGDAPADYLAKQMAAIVGIEITIGRIEGKFKMSQNKDDGDREGVVAGLRCDTDPHRNSELAAVMVRR